jgi:predicted protein tyrosine phosphatase
MKNILFICSQNRLRSPTAERLYSETPGLDVASAGLNNDAIVRVTPELLSWADRIFVMEKSHRNRLSRKFRDSLRGKIVTCLDIQDEFDFMEPALLHILEQRLTPYLGRPEREQPPTE